MFYQHAEIQRREHVNKDLTSDYDRHMRSQLRDYYHDDGMAGGLSLAVGTVPGPVIPYRTPPTPKCRDSHAHAHP